MKPGQLGFDELAIAMINNYFHNRYQRVFANNFSDWISIKQSVPQGTVLGSLLFSLYVNNMTCETGTSENIQYADDTVVF